MRPRFCCFYLHQRLRLGWAQAEEDGQLVLVLPDGEVVRQRADNMLYCWHGAVATTLETTGGTAGETDTGSPLAQLARHAAALVEQPPALEVLYAGMTPGQAEPFADLAGRVLSEPEEGWAHGLLFAALMHDGLRFRYSNGRFTARSAEEAREREQRVQRRHAEEDWAGKAAQWRAQLEAGGWQVGSSDMQRADGRVFLAQLQSLLAREKRSPHWGLLARPLGLNTLHSIDIAARLKSWLQTADAWPDWPAIWLQWAEVEPCFPAALERGAAELAAAPPRRAGRIDRTGDETYTIDSAGTRDFDDGFSILAADGTGVTLAMHIAEPDPALESGHPLFDEALRRMASVYSLQGTFPMLPETLSTGRFSLLAGAEREAVTFVLRIEEDSARLLNVERSLVRVTRNLEHEGAQRLLDERPEHWGRLGLLCAALADLRAAQGAVIRERRETQLDVSDPRHIVVTEVVRSGPTYQLVEELAILHNREAGRYCRDHRLPGIYRVQPPPRRGGPDQVGAEMHMAARFTTRGAGHAGLGCDRYIQTTSPIRRFPDLAMQRQIAEHAATGRVAFPERNLLEGWAEAADARMAVQDEVTRRIANDWKRRYLLQHRRAILSGVARRQWDDPQGRVWLEPLRLLTQCMLPVGVRDGDPVRVRVESIDRDQQTVWVACVE